MRQKWLLIPFTCGKFIHYESFIVLFYYSPEKDMSLVFCSVHDAVFSNSLSGRKPEVICFLLQKASHSSFGHSTSQTGKQQKCSWCGKFWL